MKPTALILLLVPLGLALPRIASAQGAGPGPEGRPIERLEQLRKVRMIEMLDMKEDQSVRFFARLNDHDSARHALRKDRNEALDKIERLVRNHGDEQEYEPLFKEVADLDRKLGDENRTFFDGLKDILTTEQRGKLLLFERKFESELREAMREARQRRMGQTQ